MYLLTLGLNHTTAPLALRERVAFPGDAPDGRPVGPARTPAAADPRERDPLHLQSHRDLLRDAAAGRSAAGAVEWLRDRQGLGDAHLTKHLYTLPDGQAVRHAFRVAAGLDSMVIGEPQILGQMKEAARMAQETGVLGTHLHHLFQRSFAVAKEVRSTTEIGAHSVSMAAPRSGWPVASTRTCARPASCSWARAR